MTDLDRKIAELKGWEHRPARDATFSYGRANLPEGYSESIPYLEYGLLHVAEDCNWSTSDAKAFELVDELKSQKIHFILICHESNCYAAFNDGVMIDDPK